MIDLSTSIYMMMLVFGSHPKLIDNGWSDSNLYKPTSKILYLRCEIDISTDVFS